MECRGFRRRWISSDRGGAGRLPVHLARRRHQLDRAAAWGWFQQAVGCGGFRCGWLSLIAAAENGRLYTSSDWGVTWQERQPAGPNDLDWQAVASDDGGAHLVAAICPENGRVVEPDAIRLYIFIRRGAARGMDICPENGRVVEPDAIWLYIFIRRGAARGMDICPENSRPSPARTTRYGKRRKIFTGRGVAPGMNN